MVGNFKLKIPVGGGVIIVRRLCRVPNRPVVIIDIRLFRFQYFVGGNFPQKKFQCSRTDCCAECAVMIIFGVLSAESYIDMSFVFVLFIS